MKNLIILINIVIIIGIAAIFTDHESSKTDVSDQNKDKLSTVDATKTKNVTLRLCWFYQKTRKQNPVWMNS